MSIYGKERNMTEATFRVPDIYTLHTEKDGGITGILSVNGYSGEVWYHSWHGPFVGMQEG